MRKAALESLKLVCVAMCWLLFAQAALADKKSADNSQRKSSEDNSQKKSSERRSRSLAVYRLDFVVEEMIEGKRANTRSFTMLLAEDETNRVRMGQKLPLPSSGAESKFLDLGLKFDCKVEEHEGYIVLEGRLDLNDPVRAEDGKFANPPLIQNFQAEIETAIPLDKPTVVGIYDDALGKRRYELRATVTKVK